MIVLFLAIAATSGFYGKKIYQSLPALRTEADKAKNDLKTAERTNKGVVSKLVPDQTQMSLTDALTSSLLTLMNNRTRYSVIVGNVAPHKSTGMTGAVDIDTLAEGVPGATLKSIRIDVRGTYANYLDFKDYLAELRKLPLSIAYLKLDRNTFEMGFRVYGIK